MKKFAVIIASIFMLVQSFSVNALAANQTTSIMTLGDKRFEVVETNKEIIYTSYNGNDKIMVKQVGNTYYQSINDSEFKWIAEVYRPELTLDIFVKHNTLATGYWQGPTELTGHFRADRDDLTVDAMFLIVRGALAFGDFYTFGADFVLAICEFIGQLEQDVAIVHTVEDYYSWSTCSIYVKAGNIRTYADEACTQLIRRSSGLDIFFLSDPTLPTAPVGCRYL